MRRRADWERGSCSGLTRDRASRKYCTWSLPGERLQIIRSHYETILNEAGVRPFLPIIDALLLQACVYGQSVIALHVDVHGCVFTD